MKHTERFWPFETNTGKYSVRKIPQWRTGNNTLLEYLDVMNSDLEEISLNYHTV